MIYSQKTISILGCGWLGLPLARHFLQLGFQVKGSTTHAEKLALLQDNNIAPYLIQLNPQINADHQAAFFDSEILLVNVPPARRPDVESFYPAQMQSLAATLKNTPVKKVLFISSTSVYPDLNREVTEKDARHPVKPSGKALLRAEAIFLQNQQFQTTILRFCGLYGPDRNPGRFLAGKTLPNTGEAGVNLIHLDDCIQIISQVVAQEVWGAVFNACADQHPAKKDFYPLAAQAFGWEAPQFGEEQEAFKIVNSSQLKKQLGYRFLHPDPLQSIKA